MQILWAKVKESDLRAETIVLEQSRFGLDT
jgi:hypothetical protein